MQISFIKVKIKSYNTIFFKIKCINKYKICCFIYIFPPVGFKANNIIINANFVRII